MCIYICGTTKVDRAEKLLAMVGGDILYTLGKTIISHPFGNAPIYGIYVSMGQKPMNLPYFLGGINIH